MKTRLLLLVLASLTLASRALAQQSAGREINLPSSKKLLLPIPGDPRPTGSFTETLCLSPDGHYLAALNSGFGSHASAFAQSISIVDLVTRRVTQFPDLRFGAKSVQTFFAGLAFSSDGTALYASVASLSDPEGKNPGSLGNGIAVYSFKGGRIVPARFLPIALQRHRGGEAKLPPYPAGLAVVPTAEGDRLLVANDMADNAVLLDVKTGSVVHTFDLSRPKALHATYPYGTLVTKSGERGYVSLWNASTVAELDLIAGKVLREIKLEAPEEATQSGSHPTAMALSADEKTLYVALSNADKIAAIDTASSTVKKTLTTAIKGQNYAGSYPVGLALSKDSSRLFVANAGTDSIAVFDLVSGASEPVGFIPTEWYPTAVSATDGDLWIATGKGHGTGPNNLPELMGQEDLRHKGVYIPTLLHGSLAGVSLKGIGENLPRFTKQVEESNLLASQRTSNWNAFPGKPNPIKHVIYIIKENRSYDQVFGDLGVGDGDPSLVLYGNDITPNEHKLALQFGVLDNFYDSGEVSGDGHVWSTAAITSDYTEKTWQISYRGRERDYDYEGVVAKAYPFLEGIADVNEPGTGYLWTNLARHHKTYRHYGEYISSRWCIEAADRSPLEGTPPGKAETCRKPQIMPGEPLPANLGQPHGALSPWPWPIPVLAGNIPTKPELRGHFDEKYPDFNLLYPDQLRVDEFLNEFDAFVAARNSGASGQLPDFVLLRLPNDHTQGTRPNGPRPAASVADNDLALGRVVDAVSHSPYWDDTAIFVLEDDAQDGADHVDAHRSIALVISKYSPGSPAKPYVEHGFYTTVSMIATMEALLGLPPMNQNDAYAPLLSNLFSRGDAATSSGGQAAYVYTPLSLFSWGDAATAPGGQPPYVADDSNLKNGLIYQMNPPDAVGSKQSAAMDFSHADAADSAQLNAILWRDRKGKTPLPRQLRSNNRNLRHDDDND